MSWCFLKSTAVCATGCRSCWKIRGLGGVGGEEAAGECLQRPEEEEEEESLFQTDLVQPPMPGGPLSLLLRASLSLSFKRRFTAAIEF